MDKSTASNRKRRCRKQEDDIESLLHSEQRQMLSAQADEQRDRLRIEQQVTGKDVKVERSDSSSSEDEDSGEEYNDDETPAERKRRLARPRSTKLESSDKRKERRRELARLRRARFLANQTEEQKAANRAKENEASIRRRDAETDEKAAARRERDRERARLRRANIYATFTEEQLAEYKAKKAEATAQRRKAETAEEAAARRDRERDRIRQKRTQQLTSLTDEQWANERAKKAQAAAKRRESESPEAAAARRERERERIQQKRAARHGNQNEGANARDAETPKKAMQKKCKSRMDVVDDVRSHSCGPMNIECVHCHSLNFEVERSEDGTFRFCCRKGTVLLEQNQTTAFPPYLQELFANPEHPQYHEFHENIRSYNSVLAFASMGNKVDEILSHEPSVFRSQGQIYHRTLPRLRTLRHYDELYVIDMALANQVEIPPSEFDLFDINIWQNLRSIIHQHSVYAADYRMLYDVESDEQTRTAQMSVVHSSLTHPVVAAPFVNEIMMVFRAGNGESLFERDFRIYQHIITKQQPVKVNIKSPHLDPMQYVLFYPNGEPGWQPKLNITLDNKPPGRHRKQISLLQWKAAQMSVRASSGRFNPILYGGKLFQQWAIDSYLQVEANNNGYLEVFRIDPTGRRSMNVDDVADQAAASLTVPDGRTAESSQIECSGSVVREKYHDAIAIVRKYGRLHISITFKCNPEWPEISENFFAGQKFTDRPDLVVRVFGIKWKALCDDLVGGGVFADVIASVYSVKFELNELPQAHLFLIVNGVNTTTERVDGIVQQINQFLLEKFNCPVSVRTCRTGSVLKDPLKKLYKENDLVSLHLRADNAAIQFSNARYMTATEAIWRLFEKKISGHSSIVYRLDIHLPQQDATVAKDANTSLSAWFELNKIDQNARQYRYMETALYYVFDKKIGFWKVRVKNAETRVIPRILAISPNDGELYYLRMLLLYVRGAQSFADLRTVDGAIVETFKEAAVRLNLIEDDDYSERCMTEASLVCVAHQLRQMYALICVFYSPTNPKELFDTYKQSMLADYECEALAVGVQRALTEIDGVLQVHGMKSTDLELPAVQSAPIAVNAVNEAAKANEQILTLNPEQKLFFDEITTSIRYSILEPRLFFLDGPAGSGKTYLFNTLICYLRGQRRSVQTFAATDIAASLLDNAQNVRRGLQIPNDSDEESEMTVYSDESEKIKAASLLILDECAMLSKHSLLAIDRLLKRIMNDRRSFGGKWLVLSGDFRQTITFPAEMCIKESYLWPQFKCRSLVANMRSADEIEFNDWLLRLGESRLAVDTIDPDRIEIPKEMVVQTDIVSAIYGNVEIRATNPKEIDEIASKIIMAPKLTDVVGLNDYLLTLIQADQTVYESVDTIISDDPNDGVDFQPEFLHAQCPADMPPHLLRLKVGAAIMLLRNLSPTLFNGTRLVVRQLHRHCIKAEILTNGPGKGTEVCIPRIVFEINNDSSLPFGMRRRQFPVRLAFAITIAMAQGQTFDHVGVYLPEPVHSHGQLYSALSRGKVQRQIKVFVRDDGRDQGKLNDETFTKNIVIYKLLN